MSRRLRKKVVVITGASSGIGRATALLLARNRASVVLASRQRDALQDAAAECERHGGAALPVVVDVADAGAVEALARQALDRFDRIDAWVNNASVGAFGAVEDVPLEDVRRVIDVNLHGTIHGCRSALAVFESRAAARS